MDISNRIVKKSNTAISSRIKGYSLNQMKIMNLAISEITELTTSTDVLSFQALDLLRAIGLGDNNHTELRRATLNMIRGIEIPKDDGGFSQVPIFHEIEYNAGGTVDIRFHEKVLPLLVRAKTEYTKYYFQNVQRLKSAYSVKIYELCKQYQNTKQGYRDLTIEELKNYLDIPLKKYPRYCDFNSRVIKASSIEISEKTDLKIEVEPLKKSRLTIGVRFKITPKKAEETKEVQPPLLDELSELTPAGKHLVERYEIDPKKALDLQLQATSDEHLFFAIGELNEAIKNKEIKHLARYAITALEKALEQNLLSNRLEKSKAEKTKKAQEKNKQNEERAREAELKAENERKAAENNKLKADFIKFCERPNLSEILKKENALKLLNNPPEEALVLKQLANLELTKALGVNLSTLDYGSLYSALTGHKLEEKSFFEGLAFGASNTDKKTPIKGREKTGLSSFKGYARQCLKGII